MRGWIFWRRNTPPPNPNELEPNRPSAVGDPVFDEAFIIKGNDEAKVRRLFADARLRDLISAQTDIYVCVKDDENRFWGGRNFPPNVDELYFQVTGIWRKSQRTENSSLP